MHATTAEKRASLWSDEVPSRSVEGLLHALLSSSPDCIKLLSTEGRLVYMSPNGRRALGIRLDECLDGLDWVASWEGQFATAAASAVRSAARGVAATFEGCFQSRSGELKWWSVSISPVTADDGVISSLLAISRDISSSVCMLEELKEREDDRETALVLSPQVTWTAAPDGRFLSGTRQWLGRTGFSSDYFSSVDWVLEEDRSEVRSAWQRSLSSGDPLDIEHRAVWLDGSVSWVRVRATAHKDGNGAVLRWYGTTEIIDDRKAIEAQLRASRDLLQAVVDHIPDPIGVKDQDGRFVLVNRRLAELLGVTPEAALGSTDLDFFPEEIAQPFQANDRQAWKLCQPISTREVVPVKGEMRTFITKKVPCMLDGHPAALVVIGHDVTDLEQLTMAVAEREARLRLVLDCVPQCVKVLDETGAILEMNRAGLNMIGADSLSVTRGRIASELIAPEDRSVFEQMHRLAWGGQATPLFAFRLCTASGHRTLESRAIRIDHGDGTPLGVLAVSEDVTERQAEAARIQSLQADFAHLARMNDLGEMAAAVAHEVKQPLTAINNYIEAASVTISGVTSDAAQICKEFLREGSRQVVRAGEIVKRLRQFTSKAAPTRSPQNVSELVRTVVAMMQPDAAVHGTSVIAGNIPTDLTVWGDGLQIQQVLVNLVKNAIEACKNGPTPGVPVSISVRATGAAVCFDVLDEGGGFGPLEIEQLFEPFFSTKSEGMGMGLSICRRIAEWHGGTLRARVRKNGGACFTLKLPRRSGPQRTPDALATSLPVPSPTGSER